MGALTDQGEWILRYRFYHTTRHIRIPYLPDSIVILLTTSCFPNLVTSKTCAYASLVFIQGMNTEVPDKNLSQSTTIRTPSGDKSEKRIRIFFYR